MNEPRKPSIRRTRSQERTEALDTSPAGIAAAYEQELSRTKATALEALAKAQADYDEKLAKVEADREELIGALQRERAEFTNFRQRTQRERAEERGLAGVDLITKVLALADDFDRAIDTRPEGLADSAWADGIANIDRKLRALLESEGVSPVEASPGTPFDPREHEAVSAAPGTGLPDNTIVAEVRRGYRLRDRVIRAALVVVAQGDDAPAARPN